jgi:amidophosphoribosyltransferase
MPVSCPAHIYSCLYGIDFPDRQKLIAVTHSHDKIVKELGLDSLGYLSEAGMAKAIGGTGLCLACFNGKYPQYCSS